MDKYNQMNLSTEFRNKNLDDPIQYKVTLKDLTDISSQIAERFVHKERVVKVKDSLGGFRIPQENLKKRVNPSDEILGKIGDTPNAGHNATVNSYSFNPYNLGTQMKRKMHNPLDFSEPLVDENLEIDPNASHNENLLQVISHEFEKLKMESAEHLKSREMRKSLNKNSKNPEILEEKNVINHFLASNPDRVQAYKHVQTQQKDEYMTLEQLQKLKEEHKQKMLQIENEYYARKKKDKGAQDRFSELSEDFVQRSDKMTNEEIQAILKHENEQLNMKSKAKMRTFGQRAKSARGIKRIGYDTNEMLDKNDERYVKKFANYLMKKKVGDTEANEEMEEDWNTTKIKSQNAFGIVNRTDGLPGHIDREDYSMYYVSISSNNTPRSLSLKSVKHGSRPRSRAKWNNLFQSLDKTKTRSLSAGRQISNKPSLKDGSQMNSYLTFIKLIFSMIDTDKMGYITKQRVTEEMKLDERIINDLGFESLLNFEQSLEAFKTEQDGIMNEQEFIGFLLSRSSLAEQFLQNYKNNNVEGNLREENNYFGKLYSESKNKINQEDLYANNNYPLNYEEDPEYPGMKTNTLNFLNYPTTKEKLGKLRESLGNTSVKDKKSSSLPDHNSSLTQNLHKKIATRNPTTTGVKVSYADYSNFLNKYRIKKELNFTIPKPFDFLKKNYHGKKLQKMEEILQERLKIEDEILGYRFHPNELKREMFISQFENIIEAERAKRKYRTEKLKEKIVQEMKPFSFYDYDERKYKEKLGKTCEPPRFPPFRANPIKWKSQVNLYDDILKKEQTIRKARVQERAMQTYKAAKLPPRMEMHEKNKQIQEQEMKLMKVREFKRSKSAFKANVIPDFVRLQEQFNTALEKKKSAAKPTEPMPFNFHEPKKKAALRDYLDKENDPQAKNPQFKRNITEIIEKMQRKPKLEPASTKALTLLMATRRKELEERQRKEEEKILEDKMRKEKQERLKERVVTSKAIVDNTKSLEENRRKLQEDFKSNLQKKKETYQAELQRRIQRVYNRPLMLETVTGKVDKVTLNKNMKDDLNEILMEQNNISNAEQSKINESRRGMHSDDVIYE